jgi:FAD/FMN-containing dehydrogenase
MTSACNSTPRREMNWKRRNSVEQYKISNPVFQKGIEPNHATYPENISELQETVVKANGDCAHLVAVSSSGPHEKNGIACSEDHTIVDLSKWKDVPWINRRNRVVIVEPGVTYGELLKALKPHNMTIPTPLAPRLGKSVITAIMDRQPHIWPNKQWDYIDPVCSTEFIFGTGELFRTGAAGGPGSLKDQREMGGAQKCAEGPGQTNFHRVVQGSQGSMGIISWVSIRAELIPSIEEPVLLGTNELEKLIAYVYEVQRPGLGEHTFLLNRVAASMLMSHNSVPDFHKILASLPEFICLQNIAGFERMPKERVAYQQADIRQIAGKNGLAFSSSMDSVSAGGLLEKARTPTGDTCWRQGIRGQCLSIFFLTTLDKIPVLKDCFFQTAARYKINPDNVGIYIQPVLQNHACQVEFLVPFDPLDKKEVLRMKQLEAQSVEDLIMAGAFFGRPYGSAEIASFKKNRVGYDFLKKIKKLFDPNRVLNPGKFGL